MSVLKMVNMNKARYIMGSFFGGSKAGRRR